MANRDEEGCKHTLTRGEETKGCVSMANVDDGGQKHALTRSKERKGVWVRWTRMREDESPHSLETRQREVWVWWTTDEGWRKHAWPGCKGGMNMENTDDERQKHALLRDKETKGGCGQWPRIVLWGSWLFIIHHGHLSFVVHLLFIIDIPCLSLLVVHRHPSLLVMVVFASWWWWSIMIVIHCGCLCVAVICCGCIAVSWHCGRHVVMVALWSLWSSVVLLSLGGKLLLLVLMLWGRRDRIQEGTYHWDNVVGRKNGGKVNMITWRRSSNRLCE